METLKIYIIEDQLGMRHATIKAESGSQALDIYGLSHLFILYAIDARDYPLT